MSPRNQTVTRTGLVNDSSDAIILIAIALVVIIGAGTWATGQVAALLFTGRWPHVSFASAVQAAFRLPGHAADPRQAWPPAVRPDLPGLLGFAVAGILVSALLAAACWWTWRQYSQRHSQGGFASHRRIQRTLSEQAVVKKGPVVRPSLAGRRVTVDQVGVRCGRAIPSGIPLAISAEDSGLGTASPRVGKTTELVIPMLTDWPGPAIVTSIRPDVLLATAALRAQAGPVSVMTPTGMISWPSRFAWDLSSGCEDLSKARVRADVMVSVGKSTGGGDSTNEGFFAMSATNLLAAWLHAAALSGEGAKAVLAWAFDERLRTPISILAKHPDAVPGTAEMLDSLYRLPADSTRSSLWATVQTALAPLLAPDARATFAPESGSVNLAEFIESGGTCYLLADERRAAGLAPAVAAWADELTEVAKGMADPMPGGRLDPPLGMFLDEVANVVPLPKLPELMSFAGGSGIFVMAILQSMAQARKRWGPEGAEMLWAAATVKVVLGGLAGQELEDIARLCGQYRETVVSWQQGGPGGASMQASLQDRQTMTPEEIRTLDDLEREALVIRSTTPVVKARLTRHYEGPHRDEHARSVRESRRLAGLDRDRAPSGQTAPQENQPNQDGDPS